LYNAPLALFLCWSWGRRTKTIGPVGCLGYGTSGAVVFIGTGGTEYSVPAKLFQLLSYYLAPKAPSFAPFPVSTILPRPPPAEYASLEVPGVRVKTQNIGVETQPTLGGKTFLHEKMPKFYIIFARKMPEFYMMIVGQIFSPNLPPQFGKILGGWWTFLAAGGGRPRQLHTPLSIPKVWTSLRVAGGGVFNGRSTASRRCAA